MTISEQILREKTLITRALAGEDTDIATNTEVLTAGEQAIAMVLGKEIAELKSKLHAIETKGEIA